MALELTPGKAEFWSVEYLSKNGNRTTTQLFVKGLEAVRAEVQARHGTLLHAKPYRPGLFEGKRIGGYYKLEFLRGVATHVKSNRSAGQAVAIMVQAEPDPRIRAQLSGALDVIENGSTLSEALKALNIFDEAIIAMLVAGELCNDLQGAISAAMAQLEESMGWGKAWKPFLGWTVSEVLMGIFGLRTMSDYLIPYLKQNSPEGVPPEKLAEISQSLTFAQQFSEVVFWGSLVVFFTALVATFVYRYSTTNISTETLLKKLPGFQALMLDSAMAVTFRTLAYTLKSGMQPLDALPLVIKQSNVPAVKEFWSQVQTRLTLGLEPAKAFDHRLIRADERVMLRHHQGADDLGEVFRLIGDRRAADSVAGRKRAMAFYTLLTVAYALLVVFVGGYLLKVQGMGVDAISMETLIGG